MRRHIFQFVDLLLYGNLFIAFCALAYSLQTYIQIDKIPKVGALECIIFSATLFTYIFQRIITKDVVDNDRQRWFRRNIRLMYLLLIAAIIAIAILIFFVTLDVMKGLLVAGAVAVVYGVPVRKFKFGRVRDIALIKIFLITISWALVTGVLPALKEGLGIFNHEVILLFIKRCLFVFAITIPFDIRDLEIDSGFNLTTIPALIGAKRAKFISYVSLGLFGIINIAEFLVTDDLSAAVLAALLLSGLITAFVVHKIGRKDSDYLYLGLLDGMMLLQFLLVFIFWKLF